MDNTVKTDLGSLGEKVESHRNSFLKQQVSQDGCYCAVAMSHCTFSVLYCVVCASLMLVYFCVLKKKHEKTNNKKQNFSKSRP